MTATRIRRCPHCGNPTTGNYPTHSAHVQKCPGPEPFAIVPLTKHEAEDRARRITRGNYDRGDYGYDKPWE